MKWWQMIFGKPNVFYDKLELPKDSHDVVDRLREASSRHRTVSLNLMQVASDLVHRNAELRRRRVGRNSTWR